ncbi:MAG: DUF5677 domain-containing protein [Candidatus Manganitrophus sp. SA1]|nr:DUF5677 domain-containing protein [Candidatus Manganitrophus morganii]
MLMPLTPNLFDGASERHGRFERLFLAQDKLNDYINEILDGSTDKLKIMDGVEHDLSLIVSLAFGKGLKTFHATTRLCLLGFGHDALILLRTNINLLINLVYILSKENPVECAKDFLAFSYKQRTKYLRLAHGIVNPPWTPNMTDEEIQWRANSWKNVSIEKKAESLPPFHYAQGYRLYSSFEHSDAFGLNDFLGDWDELGQTIDSGTSDKHIDLALVHNFEIMADVVVLICKYYEINRPDIFKALHDIRDELYAD